MFFQGESFSLGVDSRAGRGKTDSQGAALSFEDVMVVLPSLVMVEDVGIGGSIAVTEDSVELIDLVGFRRKYWYAPSDAIPASLIL